MTILVGLLVWGGVERSLAGELEDFNALVNEYIDEMPALSPVGATQIGDHRFDDLMDDVSAGARTRSERLHRRCLSPCVS